MLVNTIELVQEARRRGVAIGAFNTYNLELTRAIIVAAEKLGQPIILQLGVQAIRAGGEPLAVATLVAARVARVPVAVHLDHCPDIGERKRSTDGYFNRVIGQLATRAKRGKPVC